jgi:uncharacterized membrane protein
LFYLSVLCFVLFVRPVFCFVCNRIDKQNKTQDGQTKQNTGRTNL